MAPLQHLGTLQFLYLGETKSSKVTGVKKQTNSQGEQIVDYFIKAIVKNCNKPLQNP